MVRSESTHTTDENGEVVIELAAGDASDVARFDVHVRDQEQTSYIQRDDVHGVRTLTATNRASRSDRRDSAA